jgi:hypothetical protein
MSVKRARANEPHALAQTSHTQFFTLAGTTAHNCLIRVNADWLSPDMLSSSQRNEFSISKRSVLHGVCRGEVVCISAMRCDFDKLGNNFLLLLYFSVRMQSSIREMFAIPL